MVEDVQVEVAVELLPSGSERVGLSVELLSGPQTMHTHLDRSFSYLRLRWKSGER